MNNLVIPYPNIMLIGPIGGGKTHALKTLLEAGLDVYAIFTEPDMEVVADTDPRRFHWNYIPATTPSWDEFEEMSRKINTLSFENLCKVIDPDRSKYQQFLQLIATLGNYKCQRTGKAYGPVDKLDPEKSAVVIDSFTGTSLMSMMLQVGGRPVRGKQDYGVAMDQLEKLILRFCLAIPSTCVLTAHPEKETNEITGLTVTTISTLGQKLAPKLGRVFSDILYAYREGDKFFWSNMAANVELKKRNLPFNDRHAPSFVPLLQNWRDRVAIGNAYLQEEGPKS